MTKLCDVILDDLCQSVKNLPIELREKIIAYCDFKVNQNDLQLTIKYIELRNLKRFVNTYSSNHLLIFECFTSEKDFLQNFDENMFFEILKLKSFYLFKYRKSTEQQKLEDAKYQDRRVKYQNDNTILCTVGIYAFFNSLKSIESALKRFKTLKDGLNIQMKHKVKDLFYKLY